MKIAFITTCHNRRDKTKSSLESLLKSIKDQNIDHDFFITDDGSNDGTPGLIRSMIPESTLIQGNGNLFWNQGIRKAWETALSSDNGYDLYFLFNDDTIFDAKALHNLLKDFKFVTDGNPELPTAIAGPVTDPANTEVTYGALIAGTTYGIPQSFRLMHPRGTPAQASTLNMNCALINHEAVDLIGILDHKFHHSYGDLDYGLRLSKAGGIVYCASSSVGVCSRNPTEGTWKDPYIGRIKRVKALLGPKGQPPLQRLIFSYRHGGVFWPIVWIYPYVISGVFNTKPLNKRKKL